MVDLFKQIRTQLLSLGAIKFVQLWNGQTKEYADAKSNDSYNVQLPAVFIEFDSSKIEQLADKSQVYNPLVVKLHIVHEFLNNISTTDGMLEQDLSILELKQMVFSKMNGFQPPKSSTFVRVYESNDYGHNNVIEFEQHYETTLIDTSANIESNQLTKVTPSTLDLTITHP
jgi:hypothetical protein